MTKNPLETLVADMDALFHHDTRKALNEDNLDLCMENMKVAIRDAVDPEHEANRSKELMRCSAIGKADRKLKMEQLQMEKHGETIPISVKMRKIFFLGHVFEELVLMLVREAGYEVSDEQKEVDIDGVKGHMDGKITKKDSGIEPEVVDVKSSSTYGMKKYFTGSILDGEDPWNYIDQLSAYVEAEEQERGHILAADKTNLDFALTTVTDMDFINVGGRIDQQRAVLASDKMPEPCHKPIPDGKSGNMILQKPCTWCEFKHDCFKDANGGAGLRVFDYSNGPRYFTQLVKNPQSHIKEVTDVKEA